MPAPVISLDDLPDRITNKIRLEPASAGEKHACWIWTGSFSPARLRAVRQRLPDDDRDRGYTQRDPNLVTNRRIPTCHCTELGYATAAHRAVFALAQDMSIRDVPKLERCHTDECVSPWHVRPLGVVWRPDKPTSDLPTAPVPGSYTYERCLKLLRGHDVSAGIEKDDAADEAGIPRDQLTDACWAQYVRETPDDD